ncbi:uncharacterized protein LOC142559550 [Dermacentor variabilis]|uniref:uncharacterized protein LOC142559550 n=1 Tax=Dermacentor variabilis TaxID=34621 RepID=UPI003F5AFC52
MDYRIAVGLLSLMIILTEGMVKMVNLTEEVKSYVEKVRGGPVLQLSFDKGKAKVTAQAGEFKNQGDCELPEGVDYRSCRDWYMWYIRDGITTPFILQGSVQVQYKGQKHEALTFNLSGATWIMWNPENLTTPINYTKKYYEKKCNFTAEVIFSGRFYYKVEKARGDNPKEDYVGIGMIGDRSSNFKKGNDTTLLYNVSGIFQHTALCFSQVTSRRKKASRRH